MWRLKSESWLEVRPFEYPNLNDTERKRMSVHAKIQLRQLKIPENDPRWEHVQNKSQSAPTIGGNSSIAKKEHDGRGSTPTSPANIVPKLKKNLAENEGKSSKETAPRNLTPTAKHILDRTKDSSPLSSPSSSSFAAHSSSRKGRTTPS